MISSNRTYIKGRKTIFLATIIMAILGLIVNIGLNIHNHSFLLNITNIISIIILIVITILFHFFKIRTATLYTIATSIIIIIILTIQVLISSTPHFDDIIEKHLLTNILYILITVIISGFIIGFKVSLAQFLALIVFIIIRPFQVEMPYVLENLPLILPLIIGLFIAISFLIKNLEFFILKINQQNAKLAIENREILDNIEYAKRIQYTILPDNNKLNKIFNNHFVFIKNKKIVSNNFYYVEQKNKNTFFAVVNCTGDSVSGALMTVVVNYTLNKAIKDLEITSPIEIINYLKKFLNSEMSNIEDRAENVEIVLCSLFENKLTYVIDRNYLWLNRSNSINEAEDSYSEGVDVVLNLEKDDIIYLFSSGGMKQLKSDRLVNRRKEEMKKLLVSISSHEMESQRNMISDFWDVIHSNEEQIDGLCGLAIKF